jgi:hypothetical protein
MKNNQIKIFVVLLAVLLTFRLSESDAMDTAFVKKVKGVGPIIDTIQTNDGNYISLSQVTWPGPYIVRKVTPFGEKIWERTISVQVQIEYDGRWGQVDRGDP